MNKKKPRDKELYKVPEIEAFTLELCGCVCQSGGTGTTPPIIINPDDAPAFPGYDNWEGKL